MQKTKRAQVKKIERVDWPTSGMATIQEACQFLRVSHTTLYAMMNDGTIRYRPVRSERRISWKALHQFADS